MCGIAGVLNLREPRPIPAEVLRAMLAVIRHRGPDEFGLYRDPWASLGSARLSIVDIAGGQQPISNEDGSLWVVFNGEIFNDPELRPGLERSGHRFATHCDTEVLLHLYEQYGPHFLSKLNGQFAIALWDSTRRTLLLARDRLGIRPLHYTQQDGQLIFGSEVKSLLAYPGVQAQINPDALEQLFAFWSPLEPRSAFTGIDQVPPGHYLLARDGEITLAPYWELDFNEETPRRSDEALLDEFEALLVDATRIRLRADVPVGAYLSGGLDSSITAAIIRRDTNAHLDTFSIAFSHPQYDESAFQRRMAAQLGTDHHALLCTEEEIGCVFPSVIWHTETPVLRTSPAPMFLLSRLVNDHGYKVVLTGEGADEILAGYDIFKEAQLRRFIARHPESQLRPRLLQKLYPDIPQLARGGSFAAAFFSRDAGDTGSPYYSHHIRWTNTARLRRFLARPAQTPLVPPAELPAGFSNWSSLAQAQYLEMTTFLSPYLLSSQGDRPGMAHSVEGRFPFLDYRVVEFCNRLPADVKLRGLNEKYLLRRLGQKLLPPEIWKRTKRPYRAPIQRSFLADAPALEYVRDLLSPRAVTASGLFNPFAVEKLLTKAESGVQLSETEEMGLVGILSTQLVDRLFVHGDFSLRNYGPLEPFKLVNRLPA